MGVFVSFFMHCVLDFMRNKINCHVRQNHVHFQMRFKFISYIISLSGLRCVLYTSAFMGRYTIVVKYVKADQVK